MTCDKVRFAVLGVGRIGKIHAENLANRIPETGLAALVAVFPDELAKAAGKFNVARTFSDYRQALELPDVAAIAICSPTNTHYQIILDAAAAGKHIFCEKPIELSVEKIRIINETVEKCGVKLMVGFNRRFDPDFSKVCEAVKSGNIGIPHILKITSRDPAPPPETYLRASGGIFLDMTIHDFDMARYLVGSEVTEVYAGAAVMVDPVFQKAGDWDTAVVTLKFQNGALGIIDNSRKAVYGYDQRVEVFGSEGMIAVKNSTTDSLVRLDQKGTHSALPLNFFMERYTESYLREMRAFVESIRSGGAVPATGNDGLMAVLMGLAAGKSAKENRPVQLSEVS